MKIKFSNLGSIQETELDLRSLTVIIGPNNSNKTYIAYSIYGLWQSAAGSTRGINKIQNLAIKQEQEGTWSITLDDQLIELFIKDIEGTAKNFQRGILESFFQDSSHQLFDKTSFDIKVSREEVEDAINQLIEQETFVLTGELVLKISRQSNILYLKRQSINEEINNNHKLTYIEVGEVGRPFGNILGNIPSILFYLMVKQIIFPNAFPFPAERNAFINTYKMLANRRYKLLKQTQRELFSSSSTRQLDLLKEQGDIRYPQPVEDFLDFLSDIELQETTKINSSNKNEFQKLADEIEKQLQNKNKTNLKPTKLGGKEIKVLVKRGLEIDIYNASSSIKQLAPLLLYLRFRASKGDFLVIDEPEMNLHPESQAKLLESL
ncbi:MAG: AAA family ATPase, partial [Dolichospermum sp.]